GGAADSFVEITDDGDVPTEPEHVLDCLARLFAVEHGDDALGEVTNAGVRGLGAERPEFAVSDDQKPVFGRRHETGVGTFRRSTPVQASVVGRSTACSVVTSP